MEPPDKKTAGATTRIVLEIDDDLFRAFQRCCLILAHENDRGKIEIMNEMVRDFLIKYGC